MGAPEPSIAPTTHLGPVHLCVSDLEAALAFYQEVLGFRLHRRAGVTAALGAGGEDLLELTGQPGARRARGTTGLYHFCLLVPTRRELAQLLQRALHAHRPLEGMVDHHTHLAIYLPDPEGNGIELAWDHPREQWPSWDEALRRGNYPLDAAALLGELGTSGPAWPGLDAGSRIGHVHLHVARLDPALDFYHGLLGFDTTLVHRRFGFAFVSAGGYHHHIGCNIWNGVDAPPPPPGAAGLRHFTVVLPDGAELHRLTARLRAAGLPLQEQDGAVLARDPAGNGVLLRSA